jgi:hypothetical protein
MEEAPRPRLDDPRNRGEIVAINACQVWSEPLPRSPFEWNGPHRRQEPRWHDQSRFKLTFGECRDLPLDEPFSNPDGRWLITVHRRETTEWYPAYTDEYYVDVLRKETAPLFLEETHEQYWARFSEYFGDTLKGFFVDEPGLYNNFWDRNPGSIAWTEDFAEAFEAAKGYDLRRHLLALYEQVTPTGFSDPAIQHSSNSVRFDYYDFVGRLMQDRFMQPLADWCESKGVEHTGHLMLEEFMVTMARYAGNPFRQLSTLHTPGVDRIDEVYEKVSERIASSVAHLTGRKRVISETYALIGWKLAPPYMKEIFDYQAARGVNLLCPHAFYYSIEDFRKDECPPSEFFQNPWWPHFKPFADYVRRTCYALSQGKPVKDFLLYYPVDTIYTLISPEWPRAATAGPTEHWQLQDSWHPAVRVDQEFVKLVVRLEEAGFDFDLIDYTFLETAEVVDGALRIGDVEVSTIVVPFASHMPEGALSKLRAFAESGGRILMFDATVDTGKAEKLPNAPIQLIHALQPLLQQRPFTTTLGADDWPRMGTRRTPSVANPQREVRTIPGQGPTVIVRRLDDDAIVVLIAKSMALVEEGWNLGTYLSRRTLALSAADGIIDEELSGADSDDREFHAARDSMLLLITNDALERMEDEPLGDGWHTGGVDVALEDWSVEWPDGTRQKLIGPTIWSELDRPFEAGPAIYRCQFILETEPDDLWIHTYLYETAEARLNGQSLGIRAFPYYARFTWDATEFAQVGVNRLDIIVAGTLTGQFEGKERQAGLQCCEARQWLTSTSSEE